MMRWIAAAAAALALAGCAVTRIDTTVNTTGRWPEGRPLGHYAFQRLPSQQAQPQEQAQIEAEARPAIEAAGFAPAGPGGADVLVQVAVRSALVPVPYADPFIGPTWGYAGAWRGPGWGWGWGGGWGWGYAPAVSWFTFSEASVLIVDAKSGQPLYESRAQTDVSTTEPTLREALFRAALADFPYPAVSPRRVRIDLPLPPPSGASAPAR